MPPSVPTHLCPICGKPNACRMVAAQAAAEEPCWCTGVTFSTSTLEKVPAQLRNRACVCEDCARSTWSAGEPATR